MTSDWYRVSLLAARESRSIWDDAERLAARAMQALISRHPNPVEADANEKADVVEAAWDFAYYMTLRRMYLEDVRDYEGEKLTVELTQTKLDDPKLTRADRKIAAARLEEAQAKVDASRRNLSWAAHLWSEAAPPKAAREVLRDFDQPAGGGEAAT